MKHRKAQPITLNPHDLRRVAVDANVDPRTVASRVAGREVRPALAARIDDALRRCGFTLPATPATSDGGPRVQPDIVSTAALLEMALSTLRIPGMELLGAALLSAAVGLADAGVADAPRRVVEEHAAEALALATSRALDRLYGAAAPEELLQ